MLGGRSARRAGSPKARTVAEALFAAREAWRFARVRFLNEHAVHKPIPRLTVDQCGGTAIASLLGAGAPAISDPFSFHERDFVTQQEWAMKQRDEFNRGRDERYRGEARGDQQGERERLRRALRDTYNPEPQWLRDDRERRSQAYDDEYDYGRGRYVASESDEQSGRGSYAGSGREWGEQQRDAARQRDQQARPAARPAAPVRQRAVATQPLRQRSRWRLRQRLRRQRPRSRAVQRRGTRLERTRSLPRVFAAGRAARIRTRQG